MFNEATLHKYPALIRAFTGIPSEEFWDMVEENGDQVARP